MHPKPAPRSGQRVLLRFLIKLISANSSAQPSSGLRQEPPFPGQNGHSEAKSVLTPLQGSAPSKDNSERLQSPIITGGGIRSACLKKEREKKWPYLQCDREERNRFFNREPTSLKAPKNPANSKQNCINFYQIFRALRPKKGGVKKSIKNI